MNNTGYIFQNPVRQDPVSWSELNRVQKLPQNFDRLESCLQKKDFETIIRDSELFWLAYCKALLPFQDERKSDEFLISNEGKNIIVSGIRNTIKEINNVIKEIREFFIECLNRKVIFNIVVINETNDIYIRKESPLISLVDNNQRSCFQPLYYDFVKPALQKLAEFCGACYTEDQKSLNIQPILDDFAPQMKNCEIIHISWKEDIHCVYPILPKTIPARQDANEALYLLYQKQEFCDFCLVSKENQTLKIHSALLYVHGGPILQNLLTSGMKETANKTIIFPDYSQNAIRAFIEFIYLGGQAFSEKMSSTEEGKELDLLELFEMAHTYQINTLIDCCTNLMSLSATKENLEIIKKYAALYKNEHLTSLCEYLSPEKQVNQIKV